MDAFSALEHVSNKWRAEINHVFSKAPFLRRRPDQYTFNVKHYAGLPCSTSDFAKIADHDLEAADRLTLYVHFPFCSYVCAFCHYDVVRAAPDQEKQISMYYTKLFQEIDNTIATHQRLARIPVTSVYLGGGTPSLQSSDHLEALITRLKSRFTISADCEFTLETTPNLVTKDTVSEWRGLGIQRVSMGIEVLDDNILHELSRRHTSAEAISAVELIAGVFPKSNIDLMYALPNVPHQQLIDDASRMALSGIGQITAYRLRLNRVDERATALESVFRRNPECFPTQEDSLIQNIALRHYLTSSEWSESPIGWFNRENAPTCYADRWKGSRKAVLWGFGPSAYSYGQNWQKVNPRHNLWHRIAATEVLSESLKWQYSIEQQSIRRLSFDLRSFARAEADSWNSIGGLGDYLCSIGLGAPVGDLVELTPLGIALIDEIIDQFMQ